MPGLFKNKRSSVALSVLLSESVAASHQFLATCTEYTARTTSREVGVFNVRVFSVVLLSIVNRFADVAVILRLSCFLFLFLTSQRTVYDEFTFVGIELMYYFKTM